MPDHVGWYIFWILIFGLSYLAFVILALLVTVNGIEDLRRLFIDLRASLDKKEDDRG